MKIIGHRGARSLALENSLESLKAAIKAGVDGVEFDVRLNADAEFVLSHDATLGRVSDTDARISRSSQTALAHVKLLNGERVPSLQNALKALGDTPAYIEAKGNHWAKALASFLSKHNIKNASVISFNHPELLRFHELMPEAACFPIERTKAFEVIQYARRNQLTGVDLNFWLLNPFSYWYARYCHLEVVVYTVNSRLIGWYFRTFFPKVALTTDIPQRMQSLRH